MPTDDGNEANLESFVSTNGGVSYTGPYAISNISNRFVSGNLRTPPLPSAEVDGGGTVYVVWQDCRFRPTCRSNDIVMSKSTNGTTWSAVTRVAIGSVGDTQDHFIPGIAVDRTTSGATAHLAVTYYFYPSKVCSRATCRLEVGFISSPNGGAGWTAATQLAGPMSLTWLPATTQGRMVGDYISGSYASGTVHGLFEVATAPTPGSDCATATPNCHQALSTNAAGLSHASGEPLTVSDDQPIPDAASYLPPPGGPATAR